MKKVIHLSVDYPSPNKIENTKAVKNLVSEMHFCDNYVFALTRTSNPFKINEICCGNVVYMRFWGLPFGLFLIFSKLILSIRIFNYLRRKQIKPDLIFAHKLCFEGISAFFLSYLLKIPFWVSVRGEADSKVVKLFYYKPLIRSIIKKSSHVFFVSAWFKPILSRDFFLDHNKTSLLPNFVSQNNFKLSEDFNSDTFLTIMDLNVYKKKGLINLLISFKYLIELGHNFSLDIIGRGSNQVLDDVRSLISFHNLSNNVTLIGELSNSEVTDRLSSYSAMVLPSFNESFGMVYVESLLACVPILCSNNSGIEGFVDWVEAKVSVDPNSVESISEGLLYLSQNQSKFREWLISHSNEVNCYFGPKLHVDSMIKLLCGVVYDER